MGKIVQLSEKTKTLIKQYIQQGCSSSDAHLFSSEVSTNDLVTWLSSDAAPPTDAAKKSKQELEFTLTSLRVELLSDLLGSMGIEPSELRKEEKPPSKTSRFKFYLLAFCGALVAACEGFDGITTLLGIFSLPSVITLITGFAFALLSVAVFVGYNLAEVSQTLGVKLTDAPKLLDLYVLQMREIKSLRKKMDSYKLATLSTEELEQLIKLANMLQKRFDSLTASCKQFEASLQSPKVKVAKAVFGALSGVLFFGSGFFAGQSVAVFLLGLVISGGVTAGFAPVVLFSVAVGLAAFSLYWYIEKSGLQKAISRWFGLDEEKIESLCEQEKLDEQSNKLSNLKEKLESTVQLTRKLEALQTAATTTKLDDKPGFEKQSKVVAVSSPEPVKVSATIYSFHQPAVEQSPVSPLIDEQHLSMSC